jgi:hypothetical protein
MTPTGTAPSRAAARAVGSAALLVLAAIACGGTTTRPVQVFILAGLGVLWLLAHARRAPDRGLIVCGSGLLALAAPENFPSPHRTKARRG